MRGSLSPAALRCVLSAADASLALDRFGIMPARSRVDILSTRLVFAPTVHGSAWPAAFGIIKRTDRAKRLSTTLLLRDSAHYLATHKPCRAAVEHNPIWQHRYGGVQGGSGTTVFTESLEKCGCPPSTFASLKSTSYNTGGPMFFHGIIVQTSLRSPSFVSSAVPRLSAWLIRPLSSPASCRLDARIAVAGCTSLRPIGRGRLFALDRCGIMPARSRVDILSTRLVFAPTVHGSAWPAAQCSKR